MQRPTHSQLLHRKFKENVKILVTHKNRQFYILCILFLSFYMFLRCRNLQGAYTIISLQHTAIHSSQKTYVCFDVNSAVLVTIVIYVKTQNIVFDSGNIIVCFVD
jgi:hypothetical protein